MNKIYLYVKQHKTTGLKYFGQTHTKDPYTYKGSGTYWKRHLNKHGFEIDTINVWEFNSQDDATAFAINFSIENKIVESKDWANLDIENAKQGAQPGNKNATAGKGKLKSAEHKNKLSKSKLGKERKDLIGNTYATALKGRKKTTAHQDAINSSLNSKECKQKIKTTWENKLVVTCPHCGIIGKEGHNMKRYHFNNCKRKLI